MGRRLREMVPKEGTKETRAKFLERLRGGVKHTYQNHDVEGLRKGFLQPILLDKMYPSQCRGESVLERIYNLKQSILLL